MSHVSEGTLQAFVDDELAPAERAAVARHLDRCHECAATLDSARATSAELSTLLDELDAPPPSLDRARAEIARRVGVGHGGFAHAPRRALLRAAIVVLGFTTLASAALPDSPVRGWATGAWRQVAGMLEDGPAATAPAPAETMSAPATVAVGPVDGRADVSIRSAAAGTTIRIRLGAADRVRVSAATADGGPRFRTAPGRVEILEAGPGPITIVLPRALTRGEVAVDGLPYVRKAADGLRILATPVDSLGTELTFRVGR